MKEKNTEEKVFKAGIGYTLGNFLVKGLSFFAAPIFISIMTIADYGDYVTWLSFESIFSILIGFTIHTSFKNARIKYQAKFNEYVSTVMILILLSTIGFIIGINLIQLLPFDLLKMDTISANAMILYSAAGSFIMCYNSYVALNYEYNSYLKVTLSNALGNILLSILLIKFVFEDNTYMGRLIGSTIPMVLTSIYIIAVLYKNRHLKKDDIVEYWKWGLKYSLPTVPHGLSQIVLSQFDRIMIRNIISSEAAAVYGFSYTVYLVVSVVTGSLTGVWDQWFYEQLSSGKLKEIRIAARHFTIVFFCFCMCYMLVSPELVIILSRGRMEYYDAVYCVIPIVASGFFVFLYNFPACVEYYHAKTKLIALCTAIAAAVNVILNYLLIEKNGYVIAAYTTLITYVIYFILHYFISRRIFKEKLYELSIFIICGIMVIAAIPLCLFLLKNTVLRWLFAIVIFLVTIYYSHKAFDLFGIIGKYILHRKKD